MYIWEGFIFIWEKRTGAPRSWRSHVIRPLQWRQVSWPLSTEEEARTLRSADLHFGSFPRVLPRFFAAFSRSFSSDMASQSQGIQQLLQAEKRAAEKVAEARKRE